MPQDIFCVWKFLKDYPCPWWLHGRQNFKQTGQTTKADQVAKEYTTHKQIGFRENLEAHQRWRASRIGQLQTNEGRMPNGAEQHARVWAFAFGASAGDFDWWPFQSYPGELAVLAAWCLQSRWWISCPPKKHHGLQPRPSFIVGLCRRSMSWKCFVPLTSSKALVYICFNQTVPHSLTKGSCMDHCWTCEKRCSGQPGWSFVCCAGSFAG